MDSSYGDDLQVYGRHAMTEAYKGRGVKVPHILNLDRLYPLLWKLGGVPWPMMPRHFCQCYSEFWVSLCPLYRQKVVHSETFSCLVCSETDKQDQLTNEWQV
jgi:hypothetical protein